jgi:hypothetical protein
MAVVRAIGVVGAVLLLAVLLRDVRVDWGAISPLPTTLLLIATILAALLSYLAATRLRPAPYDPVEAGAEAEEEETGAPPDVPAPNAESARAVAELAAKAYADEFDQAKALDTKTAALVAFTGALLLFAAGVATKPPDGLTDPQKGAFVVAATVTLGVFVTALFLLFAALRARSYEEIDLAQWARFTVMARPVEEVCAEMASTYENHVEHNHNVNATRAQRQQWGLGLLVAGIVLLMLLLAWLPIRWLPL